MKNAGFKIGFCSAMFTLVVGACDTDDEDSTKESDEDTARDSDKDTLDSSTSCDWLSDIRVDILEREIELEGETVTKKVNTVLVVDWDQTEASDTVKLRFTFENDEWSESTTEPGTKGAHELPVFGVPELTDVTIQIVGETDGNEVICETSGTTGKIPDSVPRATLREFDPSIASSNRWMLGTVEKTPEILGMYEGVFTVYILDRQGRIVWYYLDQAWSPVTAYPRIARDGTHFYFDRSTYLGNQASNQSSIARTTLDFRQFEQIGAPSMTDSMDITDDGSFVYNSEEWLIERTKEGKEREIWKCADWAEGVGFDLETFLDKLKKLGKTDKLNKLLKMGSDELKKKLYGNLCYANSVVWNPLDDGILLSFPYIDTVVEVSRKSGELLGQWGSAEGSWKFEPETVGFNFEHGANITPEGTLLVSTHEVGYDNPFIKPPHYFIEFELDRDEQVAKEIWKYGEGLSDWPACKGEVFPVEGGNRLLNYGTAGVIREITPDLEVAWDIKWDTQFEVPPELKKKVQGTITVDDINNMVGHNILIDDLYALNKGWENQ